MIIGVPDLDAGIAEFERTTGVTPMRGGAHPGRGTANALVSLGDGAYLEIVGPSNEAGVDNAIVRSLRSLQRPTPAGWALRVEDAAAARAQLRAKGFDVSEAFAGRRVTPSGEMLEWSVFGLNVAETDSVPFFIDWTPSTRHPSTTTPGGCTLQELEVSDPAGDTISRLVRTIGVRARVNTAERPAMRIVLACGGKVIPFDSH